jgi:hypothetical protein
MADRRDVEIGIMGVVVLLDAGAVDVVVIKPAQHRVDVVGMINKLLQRVGVLRAAGFLADLRSMGDAYFDLTETLPEYALDLPRKKQTDSQDNSCKRSDACSNQGISGQIARAGDYDAKHDRCYDDYNDLHDKACIRSLWWA